MNPPDVIQVEGLEVRYRVGVPDEERREPQRLTLHLHLEMSFERAAQTEDLRHTVDYFALTRGLLVFGEGREWRLIETLAVDLAHWILREYAVDRTRVEVRKYILAETRHVSVAVTRGRATGLH